MRDKYFFNKETDSELLVADIVAFLRKWGMWQDVQIFTGGKCYTDEQGELVIRDEKHPEKYLAGIIDCDCSENAICEDLSNPERLLDMTFEGPLSQLLRHLEYEVRIGDVSDEVRRMIVPEMEECQDEVTELISEYLEGRMSWDPAEYDSYEEWLLFNSYPGEDWFITEENLCRANENEFSSSEEYEDFLMRQAVERECIALCVRIDVSERQMFLW